MDLYPSPTKRKNQDFPVPALLAGSEDHAFDMDAIPDTCGGNDSENETHLGMEDIDEDEGIDRNRNGEAHLQPVPISALTGKEMGIVDFKEHLSRQDYSYFGAAVRSAWAGPMHWRLDKQTKKGKFSAHVFSNCSYLLIRNRRDT